jgi:signal transduction histidine kinase
MLKPKPQQRPVFFWRGLLIVLPVVVLAAVGFVSLRQDRRLVEHEAIERAQDLADGLVPGLWHTLMIARESELPAFTIGTAGEVSFPPPLPPVLSPLQLEGESLKSAQRQQWVAARALDAGLGEAAAAAASWQAFLASSPPSNYVAAAHYALGLNSLEAGQKTAAAEHFLLCSQQLPDAVGETGLPLQPLAQFKLLTMAASEPQDTGRFAEFCSNVVSRPTLLTPFLLNAASELTENPAQRHVCEAWQKTWAKHETARGVLTVLRPIASDRLTIPTILWAPNSRGGAPPDSSSDRWLVVRTQEEKGVRRYVCHRESDLARQIPATLSTAFRIPAYFSLTIALAGQEFPEMKAAPSTKPLASATRMEGGVEVMRATVSLTDRNALFKRQRIRSFWFGSLIAAAATAALVGFVGTWRAYAKQRRLNELKSDFVSSVSHELRAPIASVRLMAESLDRGKITEPAKQRDYFRFISQECRRLSALIENVLDFARIEQGRKQYEFEAADLVALVRNTVMLMEPGAAERGVKLELCLAQPVLEGLPAKVDAKALQQALVNLVDNAIKHSAPNSIVTLGLESGDPLRLWVEDHGPGIPPEDHERIFERFYRRGSELRRETQGVGIGLSIVKHILEAHHGRIVVRSAVGAGSRFTIELPAQPLTPEP